MPSASDPVKQRPDPRRSKRRVTPVAIIVAMITVAGTIIVAIINLPVSSEPKSPQPGNATTDAVSNSPGSSGSKKPLRPAETVGRLNGCLIDRKGRPLPGVGVEIQNDAGVESITDQEGKFAFEGVSLGNHVVVVKPPSGHGEITRLVELTNPLGQFTLVYDAQSSKLGLLSISAPASDSIVDIHGGTANYTTRVYGRCDGLGDILGQYEILLLVRSEHDERFWVQFPPAVVDTTANNWQADIHLGDAQNPPSNGESWYITVVGAEASSQIRHIKNLVFLTDLPPHVSGNVITVQTAIKP